MTTDAPFDYIIVGSGAGGGPLAAIRPTAGIITSAITATRYSKSATRNSCGISFTIPLAPFYPNYLI
jgi:hypothetical protein